MDKKVIDSLKNHSMEDLIQWRNSAHDRIKFTNEAIAKEVRTLEKEMAERANQIRKLCNYKDKTVTWYKSLGKVISSRIKGIQFSDKIFTTKI